MINLSASEMVSIVTGAAAGAVVGVMLVLLVFALAMYVFVSFAYMAIGRKLRLSSPALAWIPFVGPALIAHASSRMHWWPFLLLIGYILPGIGSLAVLVFWVYFVIWNWKMLQRLGRPGWWALLFLIPFVGLVFLGIAAWGKK